MAKRRQGNRLENTTHDVIFSELFVAKRRETKAPRLGEPCHRPAAVTVFAPGRKVLREKSKGRKTKGANPIERQISSVHYLHINHFKAMSLPPTTSTNPQESSVLG